MWHYAGWGWGCGFGIGWFLVVLLFTGFIVRMALFRRFGCGRGGAWGTHGYGYPDHDDVLKRRLAAGEINEEEYQKLREILRR